MTKKSTITVVGGGSSAHICIPLLAKAGHAVKLLTRRPTAWKSNIEAQFQSCNGEVKRRFTGPLELATNRPEAAIPKSKVIILCMPVSQYRSALHQIAPHIDDDDDVFVGTLYGQAGFNWMTAEIKHSFSLRRFNTFAVGLLPWICRTIEYGKAGVTYGPKKVNVVAMSAPDRFSEFNDLFLRDICENWFGCGAFVLADNFLSLTLSVDNQVIHPSRCYGLHVKHGGKWESEERIPFFYRDFDQLSADILSKVDAEYSLIRNAIRGKYPQMKFRYMLDYLALERLSYQSDNADICESFTTSTTLGAIKPPTVQQEDGSWVLDKNHRFFTDDIQYGLCIAKWFAAQLGLKVPTIEVIIHWAQQVCHERIIKDGNLLSGQGGSLDEFDSGVPAEYGYSSIEEVLG